MTRDELNIHIKSSESQTDQLDRPFSEQRIQEINAKLQKYLLLKAEHISTRFSYENSLRLSQIINDFTVKLKEMISLRDPSPHACLPLETELNESILLVLSRLFSSNSILVRNMTSCIEMLASQWSSSIDLV